MLIANLWMASPDGGTSPLGGTLFMLFAFVGIFYFLLVRPQQKQRRQHDELVKNLRKGDQIMTIGGIVGTIVHIEGDLLTVKTGDTRIEVDRSKVGQVLSQGE